MARHLELDDVPTLEEVCRLPELRVAIDGVISPKLAERLARHPGITEEDARGRIVALSRDNRALPAAAITVEVTARILAEEGKPAGEILLGFLQARRSHQLTRGCHNHRYRLRSAG